MSGHPWPAGHDFIVWQQERDWSALLVALDKAVHPGTVSIEAQGIIDNIRYAARLVGPTRWMQVPWPIFSTGLYYKILDHGTIEQPEIPPVEDYEAAKRVMRHHIDMRLCDICDAARQYMIEKEL